MRSGNLIKAAAVGGLQPAAVGSAPTPKAEAPVEEHDHQPEIRLHREGDDIVAIEVVCGCGRTTFIECQYQD